MGFKILSPSDLKDNAYFFDPDILSGWESGPDVSHPLSFLKSFSLRGQSQHTIFKFY
jgi:hypothetical protein